MSNPVLLCTPLHEIHVRLGAKMVPFAGFEMPIQYSGIIAEHLAVRQAAGLFDVSHMGEVLVTGPQAFAFVQNLVSNDVTKLYDGRAMYAVMGNETGGILDDLLVYRIAEDRYLLVINAANIEKDVAWMEAHNPMGASLQNISDEMALMAIQGPQAFAIVQKLTDLPLDALKYYHFIQPTSDQFLGLSSVILSHTGYTGEAGLEIYCRNEDAVAVWNALMEAGETLGLKPCGLGARDTLRLEAGFCLYGNDLSDETSPLEAGLGWVTKLDKPSFIGKEALLHAKAAGIKKKLVAFVMEERCIPRAGYAILAADGTPIGTVTSGTQSPVLGQGIGMGYVINEPQFTAFECELLIEARGKTFKGRVKKTPLHKSSAG